MKSTKSIFLSLAVFGIICFSFILVIGLLTEANWEKNEKEQIETTNLTASNNNSTTSFALKEN